MPLTLAPQRSFRCTASVLGLAAVATLGGCGVTVPFATQVAVPVATSQTMLRGTTQVVEVRSEPSGATVSIPGFDKRTTPAFLVLTRGQSYKVTVSKEGYKTVTTDLVSRRATDGVAGTALGNAIDEASGAAWELNPSKLTVTMELVGTAPSTTVASATTPTATPANPPATAPAATAAANQPKVGPATPPIGPSGAAPPTPAQAPGSQTGSAAVIAEQIARLDKLLADGVITQREHDFLLALAVSATTVAGAPASQ